MAKKMMQSQQNIPRIESLKVKGYRALKDLELENLTPLTVFLGPNGSGKSTVLDVFAFLSECFSIGLRKAWDKRGRFKDLRTKGVEKPIVIELKYRERLNEKNINLKEKLLTYHLEVNEDQKGPYVAKEWLESKVKGRQTKILNFELGKGQATDYSKNTSIENLSSREMLAANSLGQFERYAEATTLRNFVISWYLSNITPSSICSDSEKGVEEKLSTTGDNLVNVIYYLKEQQPTQLTNIINALKKQVPRLEKIDIDKINGKLLLKVKDKPFQESVVAKYVSDGTLIMLAYLTMLLDPSPPQLIGIEEPENHFHPRLLGELAEECRIASERTQLIVTTHSPYFVNELRPEEVRVLYRDEEGYTKARTTANMQGIKELINEGAKLGYLWIEGYFDAGDPLVASGGLKNIKTKLG